MKNLVARPLLHSLAVDTIFRCRMTKYTDKEIRWLTTRVRYYVRHQNYTSIPAAIERAIADLKALNS
jgi:hypothetical protein